MKKLLASLLVLTMLSAFATAVAGSPEYSAVASISSKFKCGCTRTGVGTMIAKNGMVTAAHNLVCEKHNKGIKDCTFYFGWNGKTYSDKYDGQFTYGWFADFSGGYKSADDIGYVVFPKDIGNKTGWYAWSVESDYGLSWEYCHMLGYKSKKRTYDWSQISVQNSKQVTWSMSSNFKGSAAGGPVYFDQEGMTYPVLVAVYTSSSGSTGYARRLTNAVIDAMKKNGVKFN